MIIDQSAGSVTFYKVNEQKIRIDFLAFGIHNFEYSRV